MWKIFVGFILFAALAMFVIMKGGDSLDMAGEAGHGTPSADHSTKDAAPATPPSGSK